MIILLYIYSIISAFSCLTWLIWPSVYLGSSHILEIGRSKEKMKHLKATFTVWDHIFRWKYIRLSKKAVKAQIYFVINLNLFYLSNFILLIFILIAIIQNLSYEEISGFYRNYRIIKSFLLEIPMIIFVKKHSYRKFGRPKTDFKWTFDTTKKK